MLEQLGLLGLFLGCMLAATVVPFSSEALLAGVLLAGYGKWTVTLVAALGNTTGGMISYSMGWLCKWAGKDERPSVEERRVGSVADMATLCGGFDSHSDGADEGEPAVDVGLDVCRQICPLSCSYRFVGPNGLGLGLFSF